MMQASAVTTVILAGGLGRRIGGDKALQNFRGRPLIDWVYAAVKPQSKEILISANAQHAAYAHLGCRVIADRLTGNAGPLAGLHACMQATDNEWIASVPCDTPFLPDNLIARLAAEVGDADAAVAVAEGRRQPAVALYRKRVFPALNDYLEGGKRKAGDWLETLQTNEVVFDDAAAFININTQDDLERLNTDD